MNVLVKRVKRVFKFIDQHERLCLIVVLSILFASRIIYLMLNPVKLTGDAIAYDKSAMDLLAGKGYMWGGWYSRVPPFYSIFLTFMYGIFCHSPTLVCVIQTIFDVITGLFIFLIAKQKLKCSKAGLLAVVLMLLYPTLYKGTTFLATFNLFTMLMACCVFVFLVALRTEKIWRFVLTGFLLGIASLTRGTSLLFGIPMLIYAIFTWRNKQLKKLLYFVPFIVAMLIVMTPWAIRNYRVHGKPLFTSTNGGFALWRASAKKSDLSHSDLPRYYKGKIVRHHLEQAYVRGIISNEMQEIEKNSVLLKEGFKNIREHPKDYLLTVLTNFGRLYFNFPYSKPPSRATILFAVGNLILLILAIYGFLTDWRRNLFIGLYIVYFTTIQICLQIACFWYAIPMIPFILILTSLKIVRSLERQTYR